MTRKNSLNPYLIGGVIALFVVVALLIYFVVIPNLNKSGFEQKYKTIQYKPTKDSPVRNVKVPAHYPPKLYKTQCPGGICPFLGRGFDARTTDFKNFSKMSSGKQVFVPSKINILTNAKCFEWVSVADSDNDASTSSDTRSTISSFANETSASVNVPLDTMVAKATAEATTKHSTNTHKDIQTASIRIAHVDGHVQFIDSDTCKTNNINPLLMKQFFALPVVINKPDIWSSWRDYDNFIKAWGSHVITKITFGSRLEVWESTIGAKEDVQNSLLIKVCASLKKKRPPALPGAATPPPVEDDLLSVEACNKTETENIKKISTLDIKRQVRVFGGEKTLRNRLLNFKDMSIDAENVIAFINSSDEANQASGFILEPIWDIIQVVITTKCLAGDKKFCNRDQEQRISNLEFAFLFRGLKCDTKTSDNIIYQQIRAIPSDEPNAITKYGCWAKGIGCTKDDGCAYWAGCYALGPSVFQKGEEYKMEYKSETDPKEYVTVPRTDWHGNWKRGDEVAKSCAYHVGYGCYCDGPKPGTGDRFIFEQK